MRILAKICDTPELYALICIEEERTRRHIHSLISKGRYSQAIMKALRDGDSIEEVTAKDRANVSAELLLTTRNAHWDLTAGRS